MYRIPLFTPNLPPMVLWENLFTSDEIDQIVDLCEREKFEAARVGETNYSKLDLETRDSTISWLSIVKDTEWIYKRLVDLVAQINHQSFWMQLDYLQVLQYTKYSSESKQHYDWHFDSYLNSQPQDRKLSFSLCLSDPEEYEGGEFEVIFNGNINKSKAFRLEKGQLLLFKSFYPHRVKPVIKGERKSLVGWCVGDRIC